MDTKRLIGEVAARHGVRLEPDDPAFVLVTLADLMLQDAQQQFMAAVRAGIAEYVEAAERVQARTGAATAAAIRAAGRERGSAEVSKTRPARLGPSRRAALLACFGALLFLAGMVLGRMLPP